MIPAAPPEYIDSHCHLDHPTFDRDRSELLSHCQIQNIQQLIIPATVASQWGNAIDLGKAYPTLHIALGLHPLFIQQHEDSASTQLSKVLSTTPETVAIGEVGLDYTIDHPHRQLQLLDDQMEIANQFHLPLLLHVRKAHQPMLQCIRRTKHHRGIVHAFSGSYEEARIYLDQGFLIGVGGVVTRPNAHRLHRVVRKIPLESIALESDAPDLPPVWARGERNTPLHIPAIAQHIAQLRNQPLERIANQTTANVRHLLSLPH